MTKCWTLEPSIAKEWLKKVSGPGRAGIVFQMLCHVMGGSSVEMRALASDPKLGKECEAALRAMCAAGAEDARRAKQRKKAERNVRGWALAALRSGVPDARLRELLQEAMVEHTHES